MELGEALVILRRRWWLVLGLPALVAVLSLATHASPPEVHQVRLAFAIDIPRSARVPGSDDDGTTAKIGEALVDDIARIISRDVFAAAVAARLPDGMQVSAGEIASELSAEDRHRVADLTVTRAAPPDASPAVVAALQAELRAIAMAVVDELEQNGKTWFARLGEDDIAITVIDRPDIAVLPPALRARIELPLRVGLAFLVAIGLAFLLHALDPRLYTPSEAREVAGAAVLGRIPRAGGAGGRWRGRDR
jgi:capsular polysaccharide biosynthesis protein